MTDILPFFSSEEYAPDALHAGDFPIRTWDVTLASGQNLTRGALLGKITSGGKYTLSLSAASDGSQTPDAILAEDCDASGGDKQAIVYISGDFNEDQIHYGASHTAASVRAGLRAKNIYLHPSVGS